MLEGDPDLSNIEDGNYDLVEDNETAEAEATSPSSHPSGNEGSENDVVFV